MGVQSYCIVPAGRAPPADLRGIDDAPVRLLDTAGLGIWASSLAEAPQPSLDALRSHNAVVQAAMDHDVTPVPVRFGQWFANEAALADRMAEERTRWVDLLRRFAGRAEYGVTVAAPESQAARDVRPDAGSTGTAYMQQLARQQADAGARRQLAEHIAREIAARLTDVDVETTLETPARGAVVARLAHLVAWEDTDAYHAVMREVRELRQDVQIHLTGPWPPWSFAE